jgi:hypothetical protein
MPGIVAVAVGDGLAGSARSCGGVLDHAAHFVEAPEPDVAVHTGAVALLDRTAPEQEVPEVQIVGGVAGIAVMRSAGSCSSRIAFGLIGLVPGEVGGNGPRANPSCSHSMVTGTKAEPAPGLYSTRSQPSIKFQVELK